MMRHDPRPILSDNNAFTYEEGANSNGATYSMSNGVAVNMEGGNRDHSDGENKAKSGFSMGMCCCPGCEERSELVGHHISILCVSAIAGSTFCAVVIVLVLVFIL